MCTAAKATSHCYLSYLVIPSFQHKLCFFYTHFDKILNNLLSNAIKFTPAEGKIELNISKEFKNEDIKSIQEKLVKKVRAVPR